MTLEEAATFLTSMQRHVLADYAFGDSEYHWTNEAGEVVAEGYSGGRSYVVINAGGGCASQYFETEEDARKLQACGQRGTFSRNDVSG
jgi:hypothetical protein